MDYENNQEQPDDNSFASLLGPKKDSEKETLLHKYAELENVLEELDDETILKITGQVIQGINDDTTSMAEWKKKVEDIQRVLKLTKEPKNTPLPQSANIKFPLITDACYQYAARTYPEIIQDGKVVKMDIVGNSNPLFDAIAEAGSTYMNYQLVGPDAEWETSLDKLLVVLSGVGFVLKKTYYNKFRKKIKSELCHYNDIILQNTTDIDCLDDLRRITHDIHCHPNDLVEGMRYGVYDKKTVNDIIAYYMGGSDKDKAPKYVDPKCTLREQHCFCDLDQDGYEEPYIVTLHKQTNKIVRIKARYTKDDIELNEDGEVACITPVQYFTDFHFLPSPDGTFLSIGYGTFLLHMNETVNTILNELIDAGHLANLQTGFIDSRIKMMGGQQGVEPGQLIKTKGVIGQQLKDGIMQFSYKEPSNVLYQLLGLLIEAGKDFTSNTDVMQGASNATNAPATSMLAIIEQGMKRFSAIQKRLYRSLKEEYSKIFRLNRDFTDPITFEKVIQMPGITPDMVFSNNNISVFPVADPNLTTDAQRMAQAQVLMSLYGKPGVNNQAIIMETLKSSKVQKPERFLIGKQPQDYNPPDPNAAKNQITAMSKQGDLQIKNRHQDLKEKQFAASLAKIEAEITQMQATAVKLVAQAHKDQHSTKIDDHMAQLDTIKTHLQTLTQAHQQMVDSNIAGKELQLQQQKQDQQHMQAMTGHAVTMRGQDQQAQLAQQQQEGTNEDNAGSSDNVDGSSDDSGNA